MRLPYGLVIFLCYATASADVGKIAAPIILHPSGEKVLTVPAFSFFLPAQSDSRGDIFLHVGSFTEVNILKVSPSSESTVYRLSDPEKYAFYDYNVTPNGTVWALVNEPGSPELNVVQFEANGNAKKPFHVEMPDGIQATHFLALDSGVLFISGNYTEKAPQKLRGRLFLGLFNDSGTLVKNLGDESFSSNPIKISIGMIREGNCTSSEDGNAYWLGAGTIAVVTPSGDITRRIHFKKPTPDLLATALQVSNGWAAITLTKVGANNSTEHSLLVIELATGNVMGWYKVEQGLGPELWFSPNEGFTFFGTDHGMMKLVQAKMR